MICLISALDFHNLTLQIPHVIYVALAKNAYRPKISYPPIEYFTYPDEVLNTGTIIIKEPGWSIRIFDKEKTLIDCLIFERLLDDEIIDDAFSKYMRFPPKNYLKKLEKYAEQFGVLPQLHERLNKSMCC